MAFRGVDYFPIDFQLSAEESAEGGVTGDDPVMRHLCNVESVKTYEGTDHLHALVIGERVTGIPAHQ